MTSISIVLTHNTLSIEKLKVTNYLLWKMKVQEIILKNDLIGIIDVTSVDLGYIDVILKKAWKLWKGRTFADVLLNYCDN